MPAPPSETPVVGRSEHRALLADTVIVRNVASRLGAKAASYVLGAVGAVLLIRYLGVERLGQFNYASTFATLLGLVAGAGLPILLTREAARDRASAGRALGNALVLQATLSGIALVAIAVAGVLFNRADLALPIALFGVGMMLTTAASPYLAVLNAFEHMHVVAAIEVTTTVLRVGLIVAAMLLRLDLPGLVALLLVNQVVALVLMKRASDRYCVRPVYRHAPGALRTLVAASLPFTLMAGLAAVYGRIDVVMLEKMQGDAAVGVYTAGYKLIDAMIGVGANISGVLYPRMASLGRSHALSGVVEAAYRYLAALACPAAVAVTFLAPWLVRLLFGEPFASSALPLGILMWGLVFTFMSMPLLHAMNATGHEWWVITILAFNTGLNIGLNLLVIPVWSYAGAAATTAAGEFIGLVLVALVVRRFCRVRYFSAAAPVLASGLAMAGGLWLLRDAAPLLALAAGAAVYAVALVATGFLGPEERRACRRLLAACCLR